MEKEKRRLEVIGIKTNYLQSPFGQKKTISVFVMWSAILRSALSTHSSRATFRPMTHTLTELLRTVLPSERWPIGRLLDLVGIRRSIFAPEPFNLNIEHLTHCCSDVKSFSKELTERVGLAGVKPPASFRVCVNGFIGHFHRSPTPEPLAD